MMTQQSRIDARLSNCIVDEVGFMAALTATTVCQVFNDSLITTLMLQRHD